MAQRWRFQSLSATGPESEPPAPGPVLRVHSPSASGSVRVSQHERDAVRTGPAADHGQYRGDSLPRGQLQVRVKLRLAVAWFKAASATAVGCIALPTVASFA
jgi:hypothetical protein